MPNEQDKIKVLYDAVSKDYDIGNEAEFRSKLADPTKRKAFYDGVGAEYDLGSYDDFNLKIDGGLKKKDPASSAMFDSLYGSSKTTSQPTEILSAGTVPLPKEINTGQDFAVQNKEIASPPLNFKPATPTLSPRHRKAATESLIKQDLKSIRDNYVQLKNQQYLETRQPNQPVLIGSDFEEKLTADENKAKEQKSLKLEADRLRNAKDLSPEQFAKSQEFASLAETPEYKGQADFLKKSFNPKAIRGLEMDILGYLRDNPEEAASIGVKYDLEGVELDQTQQAKIIDKVLEPKMRVADENFKWYIDHGVDKTVEQLSTLSSQITAAQTKAQSAQKQVEAIEKNALRNAKLGDVEAEYLALTKQIKNNQSAEAKVLQLNELGQAQPETEEEAIAIQQTISSLLAEPGVKEYIQAQQGLAQLKQTISPILKQLEKSPEYIKAKKEFEEANGALQESAGQYKSTLEEGNNVELIQGYTEAYEDLSDVFKQREQAISYLPAQAEFEAKQKELAKQGISGGNIISSIANSLSAVGKDIAAFAPRQLGNIQQAITGEKATGWGVMADLIEGIGGTGEPFATDPTSLINAKGDFDFSAKGLVNDISRNAGFLAAMMLTGRPVYAASKSSYLANAKTISQLQRAEQKAQTVATVLPAYIASYNDYSTQARDKGMTGAQALLFASQGALFEGLSEQIFPEWKLISKEAKKAALSTIKPNGTFMDYVKVVAKAALGEASEEAAVELFAPINTMLSNLVADKDAQLDTVDIANLQQALFLGAAMGGGLSSLTARGEVKRMREWASATMAKNPDEAIEAINSMTEQGVITPEQGETFLNEIESYQDVIEVMPEGLSTQKVAAITPLYNELKDAEEKAADETIDEVFREPYKAKSRELNTQIQNILVDEKFDNTFNEEFTKEVSGITAEGINEDTEPTTEQPELEKPSKETETPVSEKKFARYADLGDGFTDADLMKESDSESIFEINQTSPTEAEYSVNPDEAAQKTALSNINFYLGKTTNQEGDLSGKILTTKPGKLRKEGNKWNIVEKATVSSTPAKEQKRVPDQKTGKILPVAKEIKETPGVEPKLEGLKKELVAANKIELTDAGTVKEVRQNSGAPSQLYKDLSAILGDKGTALNEYLKIKDDKGEFKKKNTDWENKIMKDFGRAGLSYTIDFGNTDEYASSTVGDEGKINITFSNDKVRREADFSKVKGEYLETLTESVKGDPMADEVINLYNKNVNKLRDLKLHLIHEKLIEAQKGAVTAQDIIDSLNEVKRIAEIPLAKDYFGEPLIFMHAGGQGIEKFRKPGGEGYKANDPLTGSAGIYFSRDLNQAGKYSKLEEGKPGENKDIYYTFLKTTNPYYITDPAAQAQYPLKDSVTLTNKDVEELRKLGYDSIIWDAEGAPKYEVVVFDPEQIEIITSFRKQISDPEIAALNKEAENMGWTNIFSATNSVNKRLGSEYKDYREIPKKDLKIVSQERKMERIQKKRQEKESTPIFQVPYEKYNPNVRDKGEPIKLSVDGSFEIDQYGKEYVIYDVDSGFEIGTGTSKKSAVEAANKNLLRLKKGVSVKAQAEKTRKREYELAVGYSLQPGLEEKSPMLQSIEKGGITVEQAITNIESAGLEVPKEILDLQGSKKEIKEAAKELADKIRKGKINKPDIFSASLGTQVWDAAIETIATTVELGGTLAQGISDAVAYVKGTDWYKRLDTDAQKKAIKAVEGYTIEEKEPEQKERRFTKQILSSADISDSFKDAISEDKIYYDVLPNRVSLAEANAIIETVGVDEAIKQVSNPKGKMPLAVRMTTAQVLIKKLNDAGEFDRLDDLLDTIVKDSTEYGQGIQALSLFSALTPEGQLRRTKKMITQQREERAKKDRKRTKKIIAGLKKANEEAVGEAIERVKSKIEDVSKVEPKPTLEKPSFASKNKVYTKAKKDAALKALRSKLLSAPLPPELIDVAGYYIEGGLREFTSFSEKMVKAVGKKVRPYLKEAYLSVKKRLLEEGYIESEFNTEEEVDNFFMEETFRPVITKLEKAISAQNKTEADEAISELQNLEKQNGLWGQYRDYAVRRLKSIGQSSIQKDIEEISPLKDFTDGLVRNIRQQMNVSSKRGEVSEKKDIEIIGDAYKNFEKYKEVWDRAKEEFEKKYSKNEDALVQMDNYFGSLWLGHFSNRMIKSSVKQGLKDLDIKIEEIIRRHYTVYDGVKKKLTDKLIEEAGLEGRDAEELALFIQREFDRIARAKKQQVLDKIFSKRARAKANIKTLEQELIELSNLGGFNRAEVLEKFAEKMEYPALTEENVKKITELANRVQQEPEGYRKQRAIEDLLSYQADIKGITKSDIATSIFYASILSGYKTQAVNIVSNIANSAALYANAVIQNPRTAKRLALNFLSGMRRGILEGESTLATGYSPIKGKAEIMPALERVKFLGGKFNPASYYKYVRRFMVASDVVFYEAQKEMRAYQLARKMAVAEGKLDPSINVFNRAIELLGKNKLVIERAKEQAQVEYEQDIAKIEAAGITGAQKKAEMFQANINRMRREYELIEANRNEDIIEQSKSFAARGTYNYEPEGLMGAMAAGINFVTSRIPLLKLAVPFTNIIANVVNETLNYTPLGAIRAAKGTGTITPYNKRELSEQEKVDLYVKAIQGFTAMVALFLLSEPGDDNEPKVQITANGTGDIKNNFELMNTGWQPYSVKVGDKWISYQFTPLFIPLAFIGNIRDFQAYRTEKIDDEWWDVYSVSAGLTSRTILDASFIKGVNEILAAALDPRNEDKVEGFLSGLARTAKTFVVPNLFTQVYKDIQVYNDTPTKETRGKAIATQLKDIPVARNMYYDKINALGDPIVVDPDRIISSRPDKQETEIWEFIADKKAWIGGIEKKTAIVYDPVLGKDRVFTDKEFYDFSKLRGQYIKNEIVENMEEWKELTSEEVKEKISSLKTRATKFAKEQLDLNVEKED